MTSSHQTELPLRRVAIDFDGVPFAWHPERPRLASVANAITWAAVVFERRLCASFRDALPLIEDPDLVAECEDFIAQEATHSRVHRAHMKALIKAHPQLDALLPELEALAEDALGHRTLLERLAFGAIVEGWLAPVGRYLVAERERLFRGGDVRVASLFLWHFSEEIEHRSTALRLYRHMRRLEGAPRTLRHRRVFPTLRLSRAGARIIDRHFSRIHGHAPGPMALPAGLALLRLMGGLAASHLPGHDAGATGCPTWAKDYLTRIHAGTGPVEAWTGATLAPRSRTLSPQTPGASAT